MPELPEVETLRRDLAAHVVGRRVESAVVTGARTVRRQDPESLVESLTGARIVAAGRAGKYLTLTLDEGDVLVIHLRMSGQLRLHDPVDGIAPHTHAVLTLDDGHELRFVDPRTFGELFVVPPQDVPAFSYDPVSAPVPRARLAALLAGRRLAVKGFLMDARFMAGIGNIYSDEILHRARIAHHRRTDTLTGHEVGRLWRAVGEVIDEAVELRGSSLSDAQYVDLFGRPGSFQGSHRVYAREGRPCPRCATLIRRSPFQQRSTFYCPRCQR